MLGLHDCRNRCNRSRCHTVGVSRDKIYKNVPKAVLSEKADCDSGSREACPDGKESAGAAHPQIAGVFSVWGKVQDDSCLLFIMILLDNFTRIGKIVQ